MTSDVRINIENVVLGSPDITKREVANMICSMFAAYRTSGKTLDEAYLAALKDAEWLVPKIRSLLKEPTESD